MGEDIIYSDKELADIQDQINVLNNKIAVCLDNPKLDGEPLELFYFALDTTKYTQRLLNAVRILQRKLIINSK